MNNLLVIASFFSFLFGTSNDRPDIKMTEKHISSFSKKMIARGYDVRGSGGAMMHNIETVNLSYGIKKNVGIDEARTLIVETSQELLNEFNKDDKLRPFLANYPFNHKNLNLHLCFLNEQRIMNEVGIASVMIIDDKVYYAISKSKSTPLITLHEETYAEALEKVKSQKARSCAVAEQVDNH